MRCLQQTVVNSFQPESPHGTETPTIMLRSDSMQLSDAVPSNLWGSAWPPKLQFSCDICFKSFSNKKSLQNHAGIHKGKTTCTVCNTVFSTTSNLNFHMRKTHNTAMSDFDLWNIRKVSKLCVYSRWSRTNRFWRLCFEKHQKTTRGKKVYWMFAMQQSDYSCGQHEAALWGAPLQEGLQLPSLQEKLQD